MVRMCGGELVNVSCLFPVNFASFKYSAYGITHRQMEGTKGKQVIWPNKGKGPKRKNSVQNTKFVQMENHSLKGTHRKSALG